MPEWDTGGVETLCHMVMFLARLGFYMGILLIIVIILDLIGL